MYNRVNVLLLNVLESISSVMQRTLLAKFVPESELRVRSRYVCLVVSKLYSNAFSKFPPLFIVRLGQG